MDDVPPRFVALLRFTLSRMASTGIIKDDFVDQSFWSGLPAKFRAFKSNAKQDAKKMIDPPKTRVINN